MRSLVLILPAALRDAGNAISAALGYGDGTYCVPLSPSGAEPATHYGSHVADAGADFLAALDSVRTGNVPPGVDAAAVQAVLADLISDLVETDDGRGHFGAVVAAHGLQRTPTP